MTFSSLFVAITNTYIQSLKSPKWSAKITHVQWEEKKKARKKTPILENEFKFKSPKPKRLQFWHSLTLIA